jgi:hypothetical protein
VAQGCKQLAFIGPSKVEEAGLLTPFHDLHRCAAKKNEPRANPFPHRR